MLNVELKVQRRRAGAWIQPNVYKVGNGAAQVVLQQALSMLPLGFDCFICIAEAHSVSPDSQL